MQRNGADRRVVTLGGGHGLAAGLRALRQLPVHPTAVVTTADDGGSTGRLRRDLDVIAPGDLRMALLALAKDSVLSGVFAHRFRAGDLSGHALGNLLLVALAEQHDGDFVAALDTAGKVLGCAGRVLPATTVPVHLAARVGGGLLRGQARITSVGETIEEIWLEPADAAACPAAVDAITHADAVVLGPGSLYTSVVANLLVSDIAAAVAATTAPVIYIANLRTQRGETVGLDLAAHVTVVQRMLGTRKLDAVVAHAGAVRREGARESDPEPLGSEVPAGLADRIIRADVAVRDGGAAGAEHDPARLAAALADALDLRVAPAAGHS